MAARTPTTFNVYNNLSEVRPGGMVLASLHDAVLNDQQFVRDRSELLLSTATYGTATGAARTTLGRFTVRGRDLCGTAGQFENVAFCIRCKCTVDNNFVVGLYDPNQAAWFDYTVSASRTTYTWRGWTPDAGSLQAPTDGVAVQYLLGAYIPNPGSGNVRITGIGIFAPA